MKVVLFCGGLGTRLREHSDTIPKPLVNIGERPIIWHIMRYYAHYGHKDFILCLGYRGDLIRQFFLDYNPYIANDFVMADGGRAMEPQKSDIDDWKITFVDTGLHSNIAERLTFVRKYLDGEEMFLANYSDQLCDLPLDSYIEEVKAKDVLAGFLSVRPSQSYHSVQADQDGYVTAMPKTSESDFWVNGGYFVLRQGIFDNIKPGEELVVEPFARLCEQKNVWTKRYTGFWKAMDTFKDKITFDRMAGSGDQPWRVWKD